MHNSFRQLAKGQLERLEQPHLLPRKWPKVSGLMGGSLTALGMLLGNAAAIWIDSGLDRLIGQ